MAGGWDADALAGQMEDVMERQQETAEAHSQKDESAPEKRARNVQIESLRLSKARITDQLSRATNPAHRAVLERALQALETQMSEQGG